MIAAVRMAGLSLPGALNTMSEVIDKLLILQDCDKKILQYTKELKEAIATEERLNQKLEATQSGYLAKKEEEKRAESSRDRIDLDIKAKKDQIAKYQTQQMQTKKNEEYQALGREIETALGVIDELETSELEVMEQIDVLVGEVAAAKAEADGLATDVEQEMGVLGERKRFLESSLVELKSERGGLRDAVDAKVGRRYDQLFLKKAGTVIVGIDRGVCGGCHMRLPAHAVIATKKGEDVEVCTNCGRILYYTRDMRDPEEI